MDIAACFPGRMPREERWSSRLEPESLAAFFAAIWGARVLLAHAWIKPQHLTAYVSSIVASEPGEYVACTAV